MSNLKNRSKIFESIMVFGSIVLGILSINLLLLTREGIDIEFVRQAIAWQVILSFIVTLFGFVMSFMAKSQENRNV